MKIKNIGSNQTEVELNDGTLILVSYSTPVAAFISGEGYLKTDKKYSTTTSRHINKWTEKRATEKPQQFFDDLYNKA